MAETALFINRTDLVRNTIIAGSVDTDKFIMFIKIAQVMHLQNYMGSALYNEISNKILASQSANPVPVDADTTELLNEYLQPMLIHFSMVDYLPFSSVELRNGGLYKHTAENATSPSKDEVDFLVQNIEILQNFILDDLLIIWHLMQLVNSLNTGKIETTKCTLI